MRGDHLCNAKIDCRNRVAGRARLTEHVLIAGDGPVAMLLALALTEHGIAFRMCGEGRAAADRPIALSHGSRLLLEQFGAFEPGTATPIETIHVSQSGAFGRTLIRAAD